MSSASPRPRRAEVTPRVAPTPGGRARAIDAELEAVLAARRPLRVWLIGPPGSGRTTALQHLAALAGEHRELRLCDDGQRDHGDARVVVRAATAAPAARAGDHTWFLSPWRDDDCERWLTLHHPDRAAAALAVWQRPAPIPDLRQFPGLCTAVLDHLARIAGTAAGDGGDAFCALAFVLGHRLGQRRADARRRALLSLAPGAPPATTAAAGWSAHLHSLSVRTLLAAEELVRAAVARRESPFPPRDWPPELVTAVSHLLQADPVLLHSLLERAMRPPRRAGLLLSLLCVGIDGFRPPNARLRDLAGARLCGADLRGVQLAGSTLRDASLRRADLRRVDLRAADLRGADLRGARLEGAVLDEARLTGARFDPEQRPVAPRQRALRDDGVA